MTKGVIYYCARLKGDYHGTLVGEQQLYGEEFLHVKNSIDGMVDVISNSDLVYLYGLSSASSEQRNGSEHLPESCS